MSACNKVCPHGSKVELCIHCEYEIKIESEVERLKEENKALEQLAGDPFKSSVMPEVSALRFEIEQLKKERNEFKQSLLRAITVIASCDRCKNLAPRIYPFPLSEKEGRA